jgi:hypothetical protein
MKFLPVSYHWQKSGTRGGVKSFLLGVAPLRFIPAGNCSRIVSYSAWLHCVSYRQETVCEGFPTRRGSTVFLADRKLFAKGFLPGVTLWRFLPAGNFSMGDFSTPLRYARNDRGGVATLRFLPAGNCLRRVSYSTWHCGVSYRQESFRWEISRLRFATLEMTEGRGASMFHTVQ